MERNGTYGHIITLIAGLLAGLGLTGTVAAQAAKLDVPLLYVTRDTPPVIPLSLLDLPAEQEGLLGAQLGLNDNQTTGNFLGHDYSMESVIAGIDEDLTASVKPFIDAGRLLVIADLPAEDLRAWQTTIRRQC